MAELTLKDPLSGAEIVEIILQEMEKRLRADCTLQPDLTYAGFTSRYQINVAFARSLTKPTMAWGSVTQLAIEEGTETEPAGAAEIIDEYVAGAPNVERQGHNLPIPVMVSTPAGLERRKVKIERAGKK